jgi:integrase
MVALRSILRHALDEELIESDPSQGITIRLGSRYVSKVDIPSKAEMTRALVFARELACAGDKRIAESWRRYRPMLETLTYAGLRLSELRGLRRCDVDTENHTISVRQRADRDGRIGPPKSAKGRRVIHIPPTLSADLKTWMGTHNFELVFPSRTGVPMAQENVAKRMWGEVLRRAGIRAYSVHAIRHFCASRLIEGGASPKELSEAMGHSDEGFTLRVYGHLFRDAESEQRRKDRAAALVL